MLLVVVVKHKGSSLEFSKAGLAGLVIDLLSLLDLLDLLSLLNLLDLLVLHVHRSVKDPNTDVRHAVISAGIVDRSCDRKSETSVKACHFHGLATVSVVDDGNNWRKGYLLRNKNHV